MALSFSEFGLPDQLLYAAYLATHYGSGVDFVASGPGVSACDVVTSGRGVDFLRGSESSAFSYFAALLRERSRGAYSGGRSNGVGFAGAGEQDGGGFGGGDAGDGSGTGLSCGSCRHSIEGDLVASESILGGHSSGAGSARVQDGVIVGSGALEENALCDSIPVGGGVDSAQVSPLGVNTERNRKWRAEKKERKQRKRAGIQGSDWRRDASGVGSSVVGDEDLAVKLSASLASKRIAENELAEANARRRLEVLRAIDVEADIRRQRSRISAVTERNMVSIEKTHATLAATGNVPGFAETVVDSAPGLVSGSISPNSSASMAEFRAQQKKLLDSEAKIEKMAAFLEKLGFAAEHLDSYEKSQWTDTPENVEKVLDMYPEVSLEYDTAAEGKFRAVRGFY